METEDDQIINDAFPQLFKVRHTSAINDIISIRPDKIVQHGTGIIALITLVLIAAKWGIKYPENIKGTATLTAFDAPKPIIPKAQGKLSLLLKHDNDTVKQNDIIGILETTATLSDVLHLESWLNIVEIKPE